MKPKLRAVQPTLIEHQGSPYIVLSDPLRLSEETIAIPHPLAPLLELCDGTRDVPTLQTAFELRTGIRLEEETVQGIIAQLDKSLLLHSDRFIQARDVVISQFQSAPARPPALAGAGYPANPDELRDMLSEYLGSISDDLNKGSGSDHIKGVISPHIDFQRGGEVYAQVWSKATTAIDDVELAIIFGTNHFGGDRLFTLTRQNYSTPWGILPTATDIVDKLAEALGETSAFEDELHHRNEHSIELALIWLHYFLGDRKCELVPILCGSFEHFINSDEAPSHHEEISAVVDCLQKVVGSRRTLVVAAADLAHMGPAFGDPRPIETAERVGVSTADDELIKSMCSADAEGFFSQVKNETDRRRICGLAPIYMTLRILNDSQGEAAGYMQCPADQINGSLVSICGVGLR